MSTLTRCTLPVVNYPIKFLGGTVLSMNTQVGWGIDNSTLEVELIEDCVVPQFGYNTLTEQIQEYTEPDSFIGRTQEIIGGAAYFSLPPPDSSLPFDKFRFGGIITGWTSKNTSSGRTFSVKLSDPKPLLEHATIITDTYCDLPYQHYNYFNVFAAYEASVGYGNFAVFGDAQSSARGMSYNHIVRGLLALGFVNGDQFGRPVIFSNTVSNLTIPGTGRFKLDLGLLLQIFPLDGTLNDYTWHISNIYVNPNRLVNSYGQPIAIPDNLPLGPDFYKITGAVSVLELINNICELTGRNFYTNLVYDPQLQENIIRVSTVQLNAMSSYTNIVGAYSGTALDLSYGKELRSDKTRKMIMGDNIHFLSTTTDFIPFFGENEAGEPIYPLMDLSGMYIDPYLSQPSACGFWIKVDAHKLNAQLPTPILDPSVVTPDPENPVPIDYFWITETDIRTALASAQMFSLRLLNRGLNNAFNPVTGQLDLVPAKYTKTLLNAVQRSSPYSSYTNDITGRMNDFLNTWASTSGVAGSGVNGRPFPFADMINAAGLTNTSQYSQSVAASLDKIHKFVQDLGQTYYGKQFLSRINEPIAVKYVDDSVGEYGFGEKIYSILPSKAGGWVDYGTPVLGLTDPALSMFRTDDNRIKCFVRFNNTETTNTGTVSSLLPNYLLSDEVAEPGVLEPPPSGNNP